MYEIALKISIFCYIFSGMLYAVDTTVGTELGVNVLTPFDTTDLTLGTDAQTIADSQTFYNITNPSDGSTDIGDFAVNGTDWGILSDVTQFFNSGIQAIVMIMKLLTGTLIFDTLSLVGIDAVWIYMIQAPMAVLIVITIVDYIRSRI